MGSTQLLSLAFNATLPADKRVILFEVCNLRWSFSHEDCAEIASRNFMAEADVKAALLWLHENHFVNITQLWRDGLPLKLEVSEAFAGGQR